LAESLDEPLHQPLDQTIDEPHYEPLDESRLIAY
jgi:hypothetical protein